MVDLYCVMDIAAARSGNRLRMCPADPNMAVPLLLLPAQLMVSLALGLAASLTAAWVGSRPCQ